MALSTKSSFIAITDNTVVIYPVTPNGVEHLTAIYFLLAGVLVIYPVTPNGVEHILASLLLSCTIR